MSTYFAGSCLLTFGCLLICLFFNTTLQAQCATSVSGHNADSVWVESVKSKLSSFLSLPPRPGTDLNGHLEKLPDDTLRVKDTIGNRKAPWVAFKQGYVQYNLNYRSYIDTPYAEKDIFQHMGTVNADFVVGAVLPVSVRYFERQSNSALFRDFRDVKVDINGPELRRLQAERLQSHLAKRISSQQEQVLKDQIAGSLKALGLVEGMLERPDLIELLVQSKERIIYIDEMEASCKWRDSVLVYARKYINVYDSTEKRVNGALRGIDSLKNEYLTIRRNIQDIRNLINGRAAGKEQFGSVRKAMKQYGLVGEMPGWLPGIAYSLRTLSLGRTVPDMSPLTVQNINVRGINAAFEGDYWYAAFTAGAVDVRMYDFNLSNVSRPRQFVYAAKGGIGKKNGKHFYVGAFKGKKQLHGMNGPALQISGLSVEAQYTFGSNHRIISEVAQSSSPISTSGQQKAAGFYFRDNTSRSYYVQWNSYFPGAKARLEGMIQQAGINFQSFNSYRPNAATQSWRFKYEQYLLKQTVRIDIGLRKNEFSNPLIVQNYRANMVFKTIQAGFRKRNWPAVSLGYIPSSQYAIADSMVYESRYQTLTASGSHTYKVGIAGANTSIFLSKFYNTGSDSLFLYYKAHHLSFYQQFTFILHNAIMAANITKSPQFSLSVYQLGAGTVLAKTVQIEGGVKINNLNNEIMKTGMYAKASVVIPVLGSIRVWYEDGYLPGIRKQLVRNEQMNIGFTRYFKN